MIFRQGDIKTETAAMLKRESGPDSDKKEAFGNESYGQTNGYYYF